MKKRKTEGRPSRWEWNGFDCCWGKDSHWLLWMHVGEWILLALVLLFAAADCLGIPLGKQNALAVQNRAVSTSDGKQMTIVITSDHHEILAVEVFDEQNDPLKSWDRQGTEQPQLPAPLDLKEGRVYRCSIYFREKS